MRCANGASSDDQRPGASAPPSELHPERDLEETTEPPQSSAATYRKPNLMSASSTVRSRSIWKKPDRREHDREAREVVQAEHAGRDDRCEEAEDSGEVDADRSRPAPARTARGAIVSSDYSRAACDAPSRRSGGVGERDGMSPACCVLALAVPFVFLHPHYQPSVSVGAVDCRPERPRRSLAAVVAASLAAVRDGLAPLRGARSRLGRRSSCSASCSSRASAGRATPTRPTASGSHGQCAKFVEYASLARGGATRAPPRRRPARFVWAVVALVGVPDAVAAAAVPRRRERVQGAAAAAARAVVHRGPRPRRILRRCALDRLRVDRRSPARKRRRISRRRRGRARHRRSAAALDSVGGMLVTPSPAGHLLAPAGAA